MKRSAAAALLLLLASCSWYSPQAGLGELPEAANAEGPRFRSLADAVLAWRWAAFPVRATLDGVHDHDARLGGWSKEDVDGRIEALRDYAARLDRIDGALLAGDDRHDLVLLRSRVKADLFDLESVRPWERDPGFYRAILAEGLHSLAALSFDSVERRLVLVTGRLSETEQLLLQARENLKNPPRLFTEIARAEFEGLERFIETGLREAFVPVQVPELKARFAGAQRSALDAVRVFRTWLAAELLPASTGTFALGPERYARRLLLEEGVETPLDALRALGRGLLQSQQAATKHFAAVDGFQNDAPAGPDLVAAARRTLAGLIEWSATELTLPPDAVCRVRETPAFRRELSFASMQVPGPFETEAEEAYYSITPPEPGWSEERRARHLAFFAGPRLALISAHETYPGHLVQALAARRAPTRVRRALSSTAFSEGWAHYCEQLYADAKPDDAALRRQMLSLALLRTCRFLASIELHAGGWSVEEAADFFVKEGGQERAVAEREARRAAADLDVTAYALGKSQILELREAWTARTGKSRKEFHDALLSIGAPTLPVARAILLGDPR